MKRSLPSQILSKDSFRSLPRCRCFILENAKPRLCEMRLDRVGHFQGGGDFARYIRVGEEGPAT